ncbi:capsule assembly Wzi family protein [Amylibacter sp.]|nr:capsule assembly Wzi family protein [Amylibacter sp.]MDC1041453.1 capsule assembly Wzi family protein [Amylibacter sp.]
MYKFLFIFLSATLLNTQPLFSQATNFNMSIGTSFNLKNTLGFYNNLRAQNKNNINFNLEYSKRTLSSQLSLNFDDHDKLNFDNSYVNYENGIANFNIGKVDRNWSFSKKSSLILSSNSRPIDAISINLEDKFNMKWLPSRANWSFELINGSTKNLFNGENSMLTGSRVIISPTEKLSFEFLQTTQWGDQNEKLYSFDIDALLFSNTNEGPKANFNKMAGFGVSYSMPLNKNTYRFYGQTIGEDEAGNLPSCYAWMAGLEFSAPKMKFPTTLTIEAVDTRVKRTTHGNCGPNTMYNNYTYDYINYDTVLGVPIDTEGTSLELFGQSQLNKNLDINYSTKFLSINDKDYSQHRLSSKRSLGTITTLGIHWEKDGFDLGGSIGYQNMILDKANISSSTIFSLYTSVEF